MRLSGILLQQLLADTPSSIYGRAAVLSNGDGLGTQVDKSGIGIH